ncbi:MAG: FtsL-like putative cell division protein [Bacteroidales bacterium]|jgi:hypothetical protein|nr:FtsL-like putative cell division protein [Bacteroidales bacterium]
MPKSNTIKPQESVVEVKPKAPAKKTRFGKTTKEILGGDFLSSNTYTILPYLLFMAFLAFIYIANNYLAENKIRESNKLRREVKELRYEYISAKSKLTQIEKQSQISKRLEKSGIKENTEPIKTIIINSKD